MTKLNLKSATSAFGAAARAKLANAAATGQPEDQLRKPLEDYIASLAQIAGLHEDSIVLVGEASLAHLQTRPDYAVSLHNQLVGFLEVKAPGKGFDPRKFSDPHDKAQWAKLKSLPNLIYTDGNGFSLWRSGERVDIVELDGDIETSGAKLAATEALIALFSDFFRWAPIAPANAAKLAETAAHLCRLLRDEVTEHLEQGHESLLHLKDDWRKLLFPNADNQQFADGYAQAVTFGLLMARAFDIPLKDGVDLAALRLKKSNSLIGTALNLLTEDAANQRALKTSLGTLQRVLHEVNWQTISKGKPEAWLYFYEVFLEIYDNKLKKQTGSYYTPPEVVNAMVRLVDEALRGPLFKRGAGLAAADVTIADPAVGTGTFLLGVLEKIAANVADDEGQGAVKGAIAAAAHRLFGFELQFGPFAVAQLRLMAEMQALAQTREPPPVNLFITDTLGNPYVEEEQLPNIVEAVAKSRREANKVKRGQPITVVIGNPPYKNKAAGMGSWIEEGSKGRDAPLDLWYPPPSWGIGSFAHHLKNLYVYFWRWATLKVFGSGWTEATGETFTDRHGIVCFISAAGFLGGEAFQKMREELRRDCSAIWVIDCSPEGHQPDVPTRIFPTVQQPICIVLAARSPEKNRSRPAELKYLALPEGPRKLKFERLAKLSLTEEQWSPGPSGWREPFLPRLSGSWAQFVRLSSLFAWASSGVTPHRTWPIAPDRETLARRWERLINEIDIAAKDLLFGPDRDRTLSKVVKVPLGPHSVQSRQILVERGPAPEAKRYAYRSFDRQWILPDHRLLSMARPRLWGVESDSQVFITAIERASPVAGPAITLTELIPDLDHYKGSFGGRVYPLWADAAARQSNVRPELLKLLAETYGLEVSPQDALAYTAAVMAHPAFTARFQKDLVQPGLRLPLTADAALFAEAVNLGRTVIWLHTYGERCVDEHQGRPKGPPRMARDIEPFVPADGAIPPAPEPLPDDMHHDAGTRRLQVGKGYIANVTAAMWDYEVSGKKVVWQWFSYRRRDRSKPIIGDRRPPSPLEKIQPEGWLAEYTTDLLNLLRVLGRLIALEPAQEKLLDAICAGSLIGPEALAAAGLAPEIEAGADGETES